MDSSFNEIIPALDEIRPPDKVKREKLMQDDDRSDYDREIEEVLYLSMQEAKEEEIKNHKFEE